MYTNVRSTRCKGFKLEGDLRAWSSTHAAGRAHGSDAGGPTPPSRSLCSTHWPLSHLYMNVGPNLYMKALYYTARAQY